MLPGERSRRGGRPGLRVLAMTLGILSGTAASAQELPFRHFTTEDQISPLPSSSVQQVIQDRLGFIWFAFYSSGIGRYDGTTVEVYGIEDGLPDLTARELIEDVAGYLWVGTESGLAVSDKPLNEFGSRQKLKFVDTVGDVRLVRSRIRRNWAAAHPDGSVWVGTAGQGLFRYFRDSAGLQVRRIPLNDAAGEPAVVAALMARRNGDVWVSTTNANLHVIHANGSPVTTIAAPLSEARHAWVMREGPKGTIWVGATDGGLYRASPDGRSMTLVSDVLSTRIFDVLEKDDGTVWAASLGSGLLRITPGSPPSVDHITRSSGLLGDSLWAILLDREQNLWFGQNGGISRLQPDYRAFRYVDGISRGNEPPTLPDISSFVALPARREAPWLGRYTWVGTGEGLAGIQDGERRVTIGPAHGLRGQSVYSLHLDRSGRLWIGTVSGINVVGSDGSDGSEPPPGAASSALVLDGAHARLSSWDANGAVYDIGSRAIRRLNGVSEEAIWVAGSGGVRFFLQGRWFSIPPGTALPSTGAMNLAFDPEGYLYLATPERGLLRSVAPVDERWILQLAGRPAEALFEQVWGRSTGAPTDNVRNLLIENGRVWIGSSFGLYRGSAGRPRELIRVPLGTGKEGESVAGLASSPDGSVWVAHNDGLTRIDAATAQVTRHVTKSDGLVDDEVWAFRSVNASERDLVLYSSTRGLTLYRPSLDKHNPYPPIVRIREVDDSHEAARNGISFRYAALSFQNEQRVLYRTRLAGFDSDWSPPTTDTRIRYTNLPAALFAKTYAFEVMAANSDGVWSPVPASYEFDILPPIWMRWWAIALLAAAVAIGILAWNRYRTASLQRANRRLELAIEERTQVLESHAAELATFDTIVKTINREVAFDRLLQRMLEQGMVLFPKAETAAFFIFDAVSGRCEIAASSGYDPRQLRGISLTLEEAVTRYCEQAEILGEGVFLVRNVSELPAHEQIRHLPQPRAMLAMEVAVGGMLEGFLVFDNFSSPDAFGSSDVQKLSRFREHALSAITKARMLRMLELKRREAEQASEAKSAFLASMSHELRTPLNSIIGFSEILAERLEHQIAPRHVEFLRLILASGRHLLNIINDILDLSKIEAGRMEIHVEPTSVRDLIESVVLLMRGLSQPKNIELRVEVPDDFPLVETDPGKLKQVLYNLLSNAVKFSHRDSRVTVSAAVDAESDCFTITVADEGIGIPEDHLESIFHEFHQVDSSRRREDGGTGLGLALVKKFVGIQNGEVSVESTPGHGARFDVTLPLRAAHLREPLEAS